MVLSDRVDAVAAVAAAAAVAVARSGQGDVVAVVAVVAGEHPSRSGMWQPFRVPNSPRERQ